MYGTRLSGMRAIVVSSNREALIIGVRASLVAIVIDEEVVKTVTSFLMALDTSSSNSFFGCSYNM